MNEPLKLLLALIVGGGRQRDFLWRSVVDDSQGRFVQAARSFGFLGSLLLRMKHNAQRLLFRRVVWLLGTHAGSVLLGFVMARLIVTSLTRPTRPLNPRAGGGGIRPPPSAARPGSPPMQLVPIN